MSDTATQTRSGDFATSRRGGLTLYEIEFINAQRAKGRSVQTIAKMLGRPFADVAPMVEEVRPVLKGLVAVERAGLPPAPPVAREMIQLVARRHGLFEEDLTGRGLGTKLILARQEAYARLRGMRTPTESYRFTAPQIASWFGRDHSTILTGAASHERREREREVADLARWKALGVRRPAA